MYTGPGQPKVQAPPRQFLFLFLSAPAIAAVEVVVFVVFVVVFVVFVVVVENIISIRGFS